MPMLIMNFRRLETTAIQRRMTTSGWRLSSLVRELWLRLAASGVCEVFGNLFDLQTSQLAPATFQNTLLTEVQILYFGKAAFNFDHGRSRVGVVPWF
jgi:hypothetical protein